MRLRQIVVQQHNFVHTVSKMPSINFYTGRDVFSDNYRLRELTD